MTAAAIPAGLVPRVKAILLSPKTEWPVIAEEPTTVADLYTRYIMILAAIPVLIGFVTMSVIGVSIPFIGGTYRVPMLTGISYAVVSYGMSLVGIYVLAVLIDILAPTFGGAKNQVQALKAAGYAYTAYWVASIATIVPVLGAIVLVAGGLYSLYLLYLGLPVTMRAPSDRALPYTALIVVCGIVIAIVLGAIANAVVGFGAMSYGLPGSFTSDNVEFEPDSPMGQLEQWANQLEQAGQNLEAAQASGDTAAQQDALGQMFGAVMGGNGNVEPLAMDEVRSYIPDTLAGLPRVEISAERNAAMGMEMSVARGTFSDDNANRLNLEVTDFGGSMGLMALAAWAGIESESQTATGYERTYRDGERTIHEDWDGAGMYGEMSVVLKSRFLVTVEGSADSMDRIKQAIGDVDLGGLESR